MAALGLREGPIHAELRLNPQGAWVLEIAPRSIGGLCARSLRFTGGVSLEELILRPPKTRSQPKAFSSLKAGSSGPKMPMLMLGSMTTTEEQT